MTISNARGPRLLQSLRATVLPSLKAPAGLLPRSVSLLLAPVQGSIAACSADDGHKTYHALEAGRARCILRDVSQREQHDPLTRLQMLLYILTLKCGAGLCDRTGGGERLQNCAT